MENYLLVDGYNIIFSWHELAALAETNIDAARKRLQDILCNYQGYKKCYLILVFDGYRVKGNPGEAYEYNNIHVIYTKEAETADQYIEKVSHETGRIHNVTVATSDHLEQLIIMGNGASRISAEDFYSEVEMVNSQIRQELESRKAKGKNYLFNHLPEELVDMVEDMRLGKTETQ